MWPVINIHVDEINSEVLRTTNFNVQLVILFMLLHLFIIWCEYSVFLRILYLKVRKFQSTKSYQIIYCEFQPF